eukprot:656177-Prorocentrum_minimum.AAC.9
MRPARAVRPTCGRGGSIYSAYEPISGGEAVYIQRENQSQEGRQCIPSVRTHPVHVVLRHARQVVVDHQVHRRDVQPARGHVRRNHHGGHVRLEAV